MPKHSAQRVRQLAYLHVSAGVAMAVGLRYAGTASETALATVMRAYQTLDLFARGLGDGENIRTPRAVMLCAMAMVWNGEGNVLISWLIGYSLVIIVFFRLPRLCAAPATCGSCGCCASCMRIRGIRYVLDGVCECTA